MPKKINPNKKCCEEWKRKEGNPIEAEICASCHYNLFAYCWKDDADDPMIQAGLTWSEEAKKMMHSRINQGRRST